MPIANPTHWIGKVSIGLLLGLPFLEGCLFQSGDSAGPGAGKEAFPGPCIEFVDEKGDGRMDWKYVSTYDDHGSLIRSDMYSQPDDDPGPTDTWSYTYDAKGYVLVKTEDALNDGRVDSKLTYVRDAEGRYPHTIE